MHSSYQGQSSQVCPRCRMILPSSQMVCGRCGYTLANVRMGNSAGDSQLSSAGASQPGTAPAANSQFKNPCSLPGNGAQILSPGNNGQISPSQSSSSRNPGALARREQVRSPEEKKRAALIYFCSVLLVLIIAAIAGLQAAGLSPAVLLTNLGKLSAVPRTIYALPQGNPLLVDSFYHDVLGWNLQSAPGNYSVMLGNGALTIQVNKPQLLWELLPGQLSYSDFTLGVSAILAKGDQNNGYGVYIRGTANGDSDLATYYRFELYGDGSYAIFKGVLDAAGKSTSSRIVDYTLDPAIKKQGKPNKIIIVAKGTSLSFIVNGLLVKTITDRSYRAGSIALFASNLPEAKPGIQVQFSQFVIYPPQISQTTASQPTQSSN